MQVDIEQRHVLPHTCELCIGVVDPPVCGNGIGPAVLSAKRLQPELAACEDRGVVELKQHLLSALEAPSNACKLCAVIAVVVGGQRLTLKVAVCITREQLIGTDRDGKAIAAAHIAQLRFAVVALRAQTHKVELVIIALGDGRCAAHTAHIVH